MHLKCFCCAAKHMQTINSSLLHKHTQKIRKQSLVPPTLYRVSLFALFFLLLNSIFLCWKQVFDQLLFYSTWHNSWNSFAVGLRSLCFFSRCAISYFCAIKFRKGKIFSFRSRGRKSLMTLWINISKIKLTWKWIKVINLKKEKRINEDCQSAKNHLIINFKKPN